MGKGELVIMIFSVPSSSEKASTIKEYADHFECNVLVETGTYKGRMLGRLRDRFSQIYSIELDTSFAQVQIDKYKDTPNITIYEGDSAKLIQTVLDQVNDRCIFWLDAHYSGGKTAGEGNQPLLQELKAIFNHSIKDHVILIDDARYFGNTIEEYDYWPSLGDIYDSIGLYSPTDYKIVIYHDIIRIYKES